MNGWHIVIWVLVGFFVMYNVDASTDFRMGRDLKQKVKPFPITLILLFLICIWPLGMLLGQRYRR